MMPLCRHAATSSCLVPLEDSECLPSVAGEQRLHQKRSNSVGDLWGDPADIVGPGRVEAAAEADVVEASLPRTPRTPRMMAR